MWCAVEALRAALRALRISIALVVIAFRSIILCRAEPVHQPPCIQRFVTLSLSLVNIRRDESS